MIRKYALASLLTLSHSLYMAAQRKTRRKSAVWEYYTQPTLGKSVCTTCKDVVSMGDTITKSANTSNLGTHLRIHNHDLYKAA